MMDTGFSGKPASDMRFVAVTVLGAFLVGLYYHAWLWTFDDVHGFSMMSDRLPYWDFTNLWAGSAMALEGRVEALFDVEAYRAALRAMFSPDLPDQEWSYPPSILLLGVPLALLPIPAAYALWTAGTLAALWLALRPLGLPRWALAAVILSPAAMINALFGQNGALTAALLMGGLLAAPTRPVLAGVLFGLLTVKPHLGILIPFCLLASGNWRAIGAAAVTAASMIVLTGLLFGFGVWPLFLSETASLMRSIMEADYPQPYHANALTVFVLARGMGADLALAYAAQAAVAVAAIAAAIWLWLPSTRLDHSWRVAVTATMAIVATPYGYSYDSLPMCVAVAMIFLSPRHPPLVLLAVAWLYPLLLHMPNFMGIGIGILVPLALIGWMLAEAVRRHRGLPWEDPGREVTAS